MQNISIAEIWFIQKMNLLKALKISPILELSFFITEMLN